MHTKPRQPLLSLSLPLSLFLSFSSFFLFTSRVARALPHPLLLLLCFFAPPLIRVIPFRAPPCTATKESCLPRTNARSFAPMRFNYYALGFLSRWLRIKGRTAANVRRWGGGRVARARRCHDTCNASHSWRFVSMLSLLVLGDACRVA